MSNSTFNGKNLDSILLISGKDKNPNYKIFFNTILEALAKAAIKEK